MKTRREFIKTTGIASLGSILFAKASLANSMRPALPPAGLQLYTFFNSIDNDVPGTLKQIADAGYKNIESAFSRKGGYYGMKPKEFASMLNGMGLSWKSHHAIGAPFRRPANAKPILDADGKPVTIPPMRNLKDNYQEIVDEVAEGGAEWLVCASTPIANLEEVKNSISVLNKTGEAASKAGIQFAFHNHDAEFKSVDGIIPYELFLKETDPKNVKMELDLAWAVKGKADPVELFKKNPGRFPLWHVKDLDAARENVLPVGAGTIDFKPIFDAASIAGMKYFFVEHDMPKDAMASIRESIKNLSNMLR